MVVQLVHSMVHLYSWKFWNHSRLLSQHIVPDTCKESNVCPHKVRPLLVYLNKHLNDKYSLSLYPGYGYIYGKKSTWAYVHPWSSHVTFVKINFCYKQEITYVSQIIKKPIVSEK